MDYTNYSRTGGGMYYQCTGGTTGWGNGAPVCYSPLGYWQDTVQQHPSEQRSARQHAGRLAHPRHRRRLYGRIPHLRRDELQLQDHPGLHARQSRHRPGRRAALRRRRRAPRPARPPTIPACAATPPPSARTPSAAIDQMRVLRLGRLRHHSRCPDGHRRHPLVPVHGVRGRLAVRHRHRLPERAQRRMHRRPGQHQRRERQEDLCGLQEPRERHLAHHAGHDGLLHLLPGLPARRLQPLGQRGRATGADGVAQFDKPNGYAPGLADQLRSRRERPSSSTTACS